MSKSLTPAEVAEHTTAENGMYIIVDDGIYDITSEDSKMICDQKLIVL